jgi:hypothetical protein
LWASCRANNRIKGASQRRQVWMGINGRKPEEWWLSRGLGPEKIWAKIWLRCKVRQGPRNGGAEGSVGSGRFALCCQALPLSAQPAAQLPGCSGKGPVVAASGQARGHGHLHHQPKRPP